MQCFVDYYNSSRGFTPRRQPCQQWNQRWVYSPVKIKAQRWGRVLLMSLCVRTDFRWTIPFYLLFPHSSPYKNDQGLIEAISFCLLCFEYFQAQHGPEFYVSQGTQKCPISTKSFFKSVVGLVVFVRKICLFQSHTFVGEATPIYRQMGVNWRCQMWKLAVCCRNIYCIILPTDLTRLKKIKNAIWKAIEKSS